MYDVARGFARQVPLTKLVNLDLDIRPYLTSLMISALHRHNDELVIPQGLKFRQVPIEHFENMIMKKAGENYDQWGAIGAQLAGPQAS